MRGHNLFLSTVPSVVTLLVLLVPAAAFSQSAQEIMERVIERDQERKASVENYLIEQTIFGQRVVNYFEKTATPDPGLSSFRLVPASEIQQRQSGALSADELALLSAGDAGNAAVVQQLGNTVMPLPDQSAANPWADRERMMSLLENAEVMGSEQIDGREAYRIRANNVDYAQPAIGGQEIAVDTMTIWVDQEEYVPLQFRMDGNAVIEGDSRDIYMEMAMLDYRQAGPMYESMRQVMRMGGILTPEQEAQMAEASQQMEQMEAQLQDLPAQQRQLMEEMMGPQMAMLRQMVSEGTFQIETVVNSIRVNAGLPDQTEVETGLAAGFAASGSQAASPVNRGDSTQGPDRAQQQACIEALVEAKREEQPRRRGLGGLLSGAARAVGQIGDFDIGGLFDSDASTQDIADEAREMGLTEEDIAGCLN